MVTLQQYIDDENNPIGVGLRGINRNLGSAVISGKYVGKVIGISERNIREEDKESFGREQVDLDSGTFIASWAWNLYEVVESD